MSDWRTELQRLLAALAGEASKGAGVLISRADQRLDRREALRFITEAFGEQMAPYLSATGDIAATLYEDLPGGIEGFQPVTAAMPDAKTLGSAGRYLLVSGAEALIESVITGLINRAFRETTFENLGREYEEPAIVESPEAVLGTVWARHASANACGFCRVMATKGPVYRSKQSALVVVGRRGKPRGTRAIGAKWHDNCHCTPIAVRPGGSYEPAPWVEQWKDDYEQAVADGLSGLGPIANALDYRPGGRRYAGEGDGPPVTDPAPKREPVNLDPPQPEPEPVESDAQTAARLLPGLEASLKALLEKGLTEDSPQVRWHRETIARLRRQLAGAK